MSVYKRTIMCGHVDSSFVGKTISIAGWVRRRRDHGGLIFVDVVDRAGWVQVVFNPAIEKEVHRIAQSLRSQDVIAVVGDVYARETHNVNQELATGAIEIHASTLFVYNRVKSLPFSVEEAGAVDEELRLKYRYLDMRSPQFFERLALRNDIEYAMREFFHKEGFIDVATPILTKNTPEGAREFVVPVRAQPGKFYALPQSPQLYKQLLMAGGIDRYYQIARCFRDEASRADRQVEFTQLDIEMSFVDEQDIQDMIERMLAVVFKRVFNKELAIPFARMPYDHAIALYGSDKPDVRFDMHIHDCTTLFDGLGIKFLDTVCAAGGKVGALYVSHVFSRSELTHLEQKMKEFGATGLLWIKVGETLESPIAKLLPTGFRERLVQHLGLHTGDTVLLVAGEYYDTWTLLGRLRTELADRLNLYDKNERAFLWVTQFPLFAYDKETQSFVSMHHPFTQPEPGWESLKKECIKARAYDLVLNGVELGGGSIRIHSDELQAKVFDMLGISASEAQQRFGFLLEAQTLGFPPHGGIALGLDRFIMLLAGCESIRDVIAFPKTARGYDPLMNAPTLLSDDELAEYSLAIKKK
jgi:aspartyl-tRNA synthetase